MEVSDFTSIMGIVLGCWGIGVLSGWKLQMFINFIHKST
jgi:hypothetical protein